MLAQIEQVLFALQAWQFCTLQTKHLFRSRLRVKPVRQPRHSPVILLHMDELQLVGQAWTQDPETAVKPSIQAMQLPLMLQVMQLSRAQRTQLESMSWKFSEQLEQTLAEEQLMQLETLQLRQVLLAVRLKRVKHSPQTSLSEQRLQLATAQEKGLQVLLTSSKFVEQFPQTFSDEQEAQFSMEQLEQVPLTRERLLAQERQVPTDSQTRQLLTLQERQVALTVERRKPSWQAVQMEELPWQLSALQLWSVQAKAQVLFSRVDPFLQERQMLVSLQKSQLTTLQLTQTAVPSWREKPTRQVLQTFSTEQFAQLLALQLMQEPFTAEKPVMQLEQLF